MGDCALRASRSARRRSTRSFDIIHVSGRTKQILSAVIIGVLAGTASPFIDVALSCRAPESEACVWGKAYLPLSLSISIPLIGGVVAAVAYALMSWRRRKATKKDDA